MEGETLAQAKDPLSRNNALVSTAPSNGNKIEILQRDSLSVIKHPLSTGGCAKHNSDFLPAEILANLTSQFNTFEDLGPQGNGRLKKSKAFPKVYPRRPPDNLWNHAKTRERFKHLTEQPPCTCGAGRDISFLYDAVVEKKSAQSNQQQSSPEKSKKLIEGRKSPVSESMPTREKSGQNGLANEPSGIENGNASQIPETLLPAEFHIVKNPGVMGLEIREGKFTTTMDDHEKHLTLFPSMKPSGRQEAVLLKKTMDDLLSRAGIDDYKKDENQPTQIHALLDLVKQEQNIYNVVFNEVIRQVSIECVERGELLADLRKRYASLLDKVPRHVKSLHEEVLAQRALDRRLTEELTRFKTSITLLTRELNVVQEHDREVTKQAVETQNELNAALKESEKNASLLAEYHELYELQRRRLEFQISKLIEERDLWAGASYTLCLKVAQRHNLKTAKRLHLHEKGWYKLAGHFAIVLSDIDTLQLQEMTKHVQNWQDVTERFDSKLIASEKETHRKLNYVKKQLMYWGRQFNRVVTPDEGTVHPPEKATVSKLYEDMKRWEEVFNSEVERFSGDILLSSEDDLVSMNRMVDSWSEVALKIFQRHPVGKNAKRTEHDSMLILNQQVDRLHKSFRLRMTGENGLAKGLIHFINVLDSLGNKLNGFSHGSENLLDPEWVRLADFLQNEWPDLLTELIELVSPTDEDKIQENESSDRSSASNHVDLKSLSEAAQQWLTATSKSIENADASLLDHVSSSHSKMVRWMVTVLLRLAPDLEQDLFDSGDVSIGIGSAIISESTTEEIQQRAKMLFRPLRRLSNDLYNCCIGFVNEDVHRKLELGKDIAEVEMRDLKKLKSECDGWIKTAVLLVEEFSGDVIKEDESEDENEPEILKPNSEELANEMTDENLKGDSSRVQSRQKKNVNETTNDGDKNEDIGTSASRETSGMKGDEIRTPDQVKSKENASLTSEYSRSNEDFIQMHVIGEDENVKMKVLDVAAVSKQIISETAPSPLLETKSSLEALGSIERLQKQLVNTEERAQILEERAISAETQLKEALERIRALERTVRRASQDTTDGKQPSSLLERNDTVDSISTSRNPSRGTSRSASRTTSTTPKAKSRQANMDEAFDKN